MIGWQLGDSNELLLLVIA